MLRLLPLRALALLGALGALPTGCATAGPAPDADRVARFRAALADPAQYPVRDGLAIDSEAVRDALRRFGDANRGWLAARLDASEASLSPADPPAAPAYVLLGTAGDDVMVDVGPMVALLEVIDPDVRAVVRRTMGWALPYLLTGELGAPSEVAGLWLGFVATAEPAWRRCGRTEHRLTVCADYGGVDVFVVELVRARTFWSPAKLEWWQRAR